MSPKSTKIYLVDDDRIVCHSHTLILKKHGYDVEVFNSAEAFLAAYPQPTEGALVLDHNMSGMSGLELQRKLISENANIPIIFITAMSRTVRDLAIKNGAKGVFEKPFDPKELVELLEKVTSNN